MDNYVIGKVPEGHPLDFLSKNWAYVVESIPTLKKEFDAIEETLALPVFGLQWRARMHDRVRIQAAQQFAEALPSRANRPPAEDEIRRLETYDESMPPEWKTVPITLADVLKLRHLIRWSVFSAKKAQQDIGEPGKSLTSRLGIETESSAVNEDPTGLMNAPAHNICGAQHGGPDSSFRLAFLCKVSLLPTHSIVLSEYSRVYLSKIHLNPLVNGQLFRDCKMDSVAVRDSQGLHIGIQTARLIGIAWSLYSELVDVTALVLMTIAPLRSKLTTELAQLVQERKSADKKEGKMVTA